MINSKIFKEYDIRGIYPTEINRETARKIGKALVTHFHPSMVAIGYDSRISRDDLLTGLADGIMDSGADVVDLGMITSDMAWFASGKYKFSLTVMITASHNPPEWNGFKICLSGALPVSLHTGLDKIRDIALSNSETKSLQKIDKGGYVKQDVMSEWIKHTLTFINTKNIKPLKVVVDASNGSGGKQTEACLKDLPIDLVKLYFDPDGKFPNHLSETTKEENLQDVKQKVIEEKADVGFMFDGDADRIAVLDENGKTISGTVITALISKNLLINNPGATILYNSTIGRIVPETIQSLGGNAIRVKTGNMLIKQGMRDNDAIFAGETSYHFFFKDNYFSDTGLITLLVLLEIISNSDKKVSELVREFDIYAQSGDVNFIVDDKEEILQSVRMGFTDAISKDELDGVSVWYKDWWFNIRPSNTENLVRLNIEADNKKILESKVNELTKLIEELGGEKV